MASAAANAIPGHNPGFAPASVLESLRMIRPLQKMRFTRVNAVEW
jgi:hypothetical protein